jgi:hypothetical protein
MRKYLFILAACLVLAGCRGGGKVDPEFIGSSDICLRVNGTVIFTYDPLTCQLAFNRRDCEFRVHTDTMSDYYCVTLDTVPSAVDQKIDGSICWTSSSSIIHKDCTFRVEKITSDGCVWLWNRKDKIGAVVKILD